jgi:GntR family transcriptional regulator
MSEDRRSPTRRADRSAPLLDRASTIPLYRQIEAHLRRTLLVGAAADNRVFIEQDLARQFGVSRMTVRQAIRELVGEGLVYRVRGAGTFLGASKMTESLESLRDNFEDWESQGRRVALRILAFDSVAAAPDLARRLRVAEGSRLPHLLRLWCVDGIPTGVGDFYLHPSLAGQLQRADVEHVHVRVAVAKALRVPIRGEQVEIEAGAASAAVAAPLAVPPGTPVLIRRVTQFYGVGRPLVAADCYYRADLYRYAVYVPAAGKAAGLTVRAASRSTRRIPPPAPRPGGMPAGGR